MLEKIALDFGLPAKLEGSTLAECERRVADYNILNPGFEVELRGNLAGKTTIHPTGRAWDQPEGEDAALDVPPVDDPGLVEPGSDVAVL